MLRNAAARDGAAAQWIRYAPPEHLAFGGMLAPAPRSTPADRRTTTRIDAHGQPGNGGHRASRAIGVGARAAVSDVCRGLVSGAGVSPRRIRPAARLAIGQIGRYQPLRGSDGVRPPGPLPAGALSTVPSEHSSWAGVL